MKPTPITPRDFVVKPAADVADRRETIKIFKAADYAPLLVAYRNGAAAVCVHLRRRGGRFRRRHSQHAGYANGKPGRGGFREPAAGRQYLSIRWDRIREALPQARGPRFHRNRSTTTVTQDQTVTIRFFSAGGPEIDVDFGDSGHSGGFLFHREAEGRPSFPAW